MGILARSEILREIAAGRIRITPYDERMVGPASVDLHLSDAFRIFVHLPTTLDVTDGLERGGEGGERLEVEALAHLRSARTEKNADLRQDARLSAGPDRLGSRLALRIRAATGEGSHRRVAHGSSFPSTPLPRRAVGSS